MPLFCSKPHANHIRKGLLLGVSLFVAGSISLGRGQAQVIHPSNPINTVPIIGAPSNGSGTTNPPPDPNDGSTRVAIPSIGDPQSGTQSLSVSIAWDLHPDNAIGVVRANILIEVLQANGHWVAIPSNQWNPATDRYAPAYTPPVTVPRTPAISTYQLQLSGLQLSSDTGLRITVTLHDDATASSAGPGFRSYSVLSSLNSSTSSDWFSFFRTH
jgi:hypothetical protein